CACAKRKQRTVNKINVVKLFQSLHPSRKTPSFSSLSSHKRRVIMRASPPGGAGLRDEVALAAGVEPSSFFHTHGSRIMKRLFVLVALLLALPLTASASGPDVNDTKLLTQPAVSAKNVAFIYAEDLWVCDHDGKNVRRLTTDIGVESNPVFSPDGRFIAFSGQY